MFKRKGPAIALVGVAYLCLVGLAIRWIWSVVSKDRDEAAPRQWTLRSQIALNDLPDIPQAAIFSQDGTYLAMQAYTPDWSRCLCIWNLTTGKAVAEVPWNAHPQVIWSVALSPDGQMVAFADGELVRSWNLTNLSHERTLQCSFCGNITAVALAGDHATLATGDEHGVIRLWDAATGQERATLAGHTSAVWCLAFSSSGQSLASGSYDRTVRLWDVARGEGRRCPEGVPWQDLPDSQKHAAGSPVQRPRRQLLHHSA